MQRCFIEVILDICIICEGFVFYFFIFVVIFVFKMNKKYYFKNKFIIYIDNICQYGKWIIIK